MKDNKILYALVILSLIFSFITYNKLDELKQEIRTTRSLLENNSHYINNISSTINNRFNELEEAARWISPLDLEVSAISHDEIGIKASWQIKDYKKDSHVVFNYKLGEELESVEAVAEGNGSFYATLKVDARLEPRWRLSYSQESGIRNSSNEMAVEEAAIREIPSSQYTDKSLEYYVSVESNDEIKASEKEHHSMHYVADSLYGILDTHVHINEKKDSTSYEIDVVLNHINSQRVEDNIEGVILKAYNNGQLLSSTTLEIVDSHHPEEMSTYQANYENEAEGFDKLIMEVAFSNNEVFTKEIYIK